MDTVDNNANVNNYINHNIKRHISSSNNIAHWLELNIHIKK